MPQEKPSPSTTPIPNVIRGLGAAMLFVNISSVMVRCLSAVFLKSEIGISTGVIVFLEGLVEGISFLMKAFSGVISDYFRRRKVLIILGYGFITLSKPLLAIASSYPLVFFSRFFERVGNGVGATPRDALVGDFAPPGRKGACYGLLRGMGTAGSFIGALIAWILMYSMSNNFRHIFWLATIPALIALIILMCFVRESEQNLHPKDHKTRHPIHWADLPRLSKPYWALMIVVAIFMIAQLGETLLILHAHQNFGLSGGDAPLIMLIFNATYSTSSYPIGKLSDRMSRYSLLGFGFVILIAGDLLLATATSLSAALVAIALCGLQMGITQSMFNALIADTVPADLRGTGFGIFHLISALSVVIAQAGMGSIVEIWGESTAFLTSMAMAIVAVIALVMIVPRKKKSLKNELHT